MQKSQTGVLFTYKTDTPFYIEYKSGVLNLVIGDQSYSLDIALHEEWQILMVTYFRNTQAITTYLLESSGNILKKQLNIGLGSGQRRKKRQTNEILSGSGIITSI